MSKSDRVSSIAIVVVISSILALSFGLVGSNYSAGEAPSVNTTVNTCSPCDQYNVILNLYNISSAVRVTYLTGQGNIIFQFNTNSSTDFAFEALPCQNDSYIEFFDTGYVQYGGASPWGAWIYAPNGTLVLNETFPTLPPPTCGCIVYDIFCPPPSTITTKSISSSSNITSSSSSLPSFTIPITTPSGGEILIGVSGSKNISRNQISNMALSENTTTNQFLLSFDETTVNSLTIAVPYSAVPSGYSPLAYIDSSEAGSQYYYTDQGSYYVTLSSISSSSSQQEHHIVLVFSQGGSSPETSSSSDSHGINNTALPPSYEAIGVIAAVVLLTSASSFIFLRRKRFS